MRIIPTVLLSAFVALSPLGAQGVHIRMLPWTESILLDTLRQDQEVEIAPAKVYLAAQRAFGELGIPLGNTDNKAGVLGSERFLRTHNLNGTLLSRLYDCGDGATGALADSYRLEIAVAAFVNPSAKGDPKNPTTTLGIATIATGRDPGGTSRAARGCVSTGRLEDMLAKRIASLARQSASAP